MMMNILCKKAYYLLFLLVSVISFAQSVPPPPENPESGDIGGYPASPIDAYTFILFLVAVAMITFFAVKQKQRILE
mgnify:FL=1